jgi:hypothetical protein
LLLFFGLSKIKEMQTKETGNRSSPRVCGNRSERKSHPSSSVDDFKKKKKGGSRKLGKSKTSCDATLFVKKKVKRESTKHLDHRQISTYNAKNHSSVHCTLERLHARWPRRYITGETGPIQNGQPSCHRQFFQNEKNEKSGTTTTAAAAVIEKAKPACAHSRQTCPAATTFFSLIAVSGRGVKDGRKKR